MSNRKARFTQVEIARVLRAAKQEDAAVEIELCQDGRILIKPASETHPVRRVAAGPRPRL